MPTRELRLLPAPSAVGLVMAGGALGAAARYGLGQRFPVAAGTFPTTTLVENVAGAALLGCLLTLVVPLGARGRWAGLLLGTGVLGAFTTFSTFATEVVLLADAGHPATAAAYVAATLGLGLPAAMVTMRATGWLVGRRR